MKNEFDTLLLAHWYAPEEIKAKADFVGDSLGLIKFAQAASARRVVFAGVRFMAETTKVMLPDTEVIIPDINATCSLVTQTDMNYLREWTNYHRDATHIMYINSSVEMKALADIIVTSANVTQIIESEIAKGNRVIFSPDENMGRYLENEFEYEIEIFNSVCDVHDMLNADELKREMAGWTDGGKFVLAHPEAKLDMLAMADFIGSTNKMLQWVIDFPYKVGTIWVATEEGLLHDMRKARPKLDIRPVPGYKGCMCNTCPYMKMNTEEAVQAAMDGTGGTEIVLTDDQIEAAYKPIERMLNFSA
jgi:quinolinate synthase